MKIASSIRSLYEELLNPAQALSMFIEDSVKEFCDKNSYIYKSRIKTEESFAEKIETGWKEMHDFVGVMIVVPDYSHIAKVKRYLATIFRLVHQRPEKPKKSQDFDFDTPRYYYKCKKLLSLRNKEYKDFIFEIQIVTLLEYSWSKLFHDYSYKSDDINWNKERISFQIKALLKNADMIVYEADKLSNSKFLKDQQDAYKHLNEIKDFLCRYWPRYCLANNLKRECESVSTILKVSKIELEKLEEILCRQNALQRGANLINLSPHSAIIQSLLDENHSRFKDYIQEEIKDNNKDKTILIVDEIELPEDIVLNEKTKGQRICYYKNCTKNSSSSINKKAKITQNT